MQAWGSILALYKYDNSIFDNLVLPVGIDRDKLVQNLCFELAELGLLYFDAPLIKWRIGTWSAKRLPVWQELEKTLHYEYNPIHNYDRMEDFGKQSNNDRTYNSSAESAGNSTEVDYKNGYNSGKQVQSGKIQSDASQSSSRDDSDITDYTENTTLYARGNIGVTSTQRLIAQQREVVEFNMIEYIIADFKTEFCIMVY